MAEDPRVAVVMAFALPFLSLSFGYTPSPADMEAAGRAVEPHLAALRPWEVAGGARARAPLAAGSSSPAVLAWEVISGRQHAPWALASSS